MNPHSQQDSHSDEKQERLKEKLRDELGPVIVGLLDRSSGLEDILVNEDSRIWVKRTGSPFEQVGELSSRQAKNDGDGDAASPGDAAPYLEVPLCRFDRAGRSIAVVCNPRQVGQEAKSQRPSAARHPDDQG
jgi:hypothetical protein